MLPPSGTSFKCYEEVLSLQPMIPPKCFELFPPDWGMLGRSRCVHIISLNKPVCIYILECSRMPYLHFFLCFCCLGCVCPSILDIKFVGRTSRGHTGGRSHRIFNPPSFCGACLDFCREKDSAIPFPRRP